MKDFLFAQLKPKIQDSIPEIAAIRIVNDFFKDVPYIKEFGRMEFKNIKLQSLTMHYNEGIEICYIHKGKYYWQIEGKEYILYPGDCFITYPWQQHGSPKGFIEIGQISWIIIQPQIFNNTGKLKLGNWSQLSVKDQQEIGKTLIGSNKQHFPNKSIQAVFENVHQELINGKFGFKRLINCKLDELFIEICRSMKSDEITSSSSPEYKFSQLEIKLKNDLAHKWTLAEMSYLVGIRQTSLNLLIRRNIGSSPGQYLIKLRIEKAKKLLLNSDKSITEIAFDCGFCSSQHFSATFKQKTGYSPKTYRGKK